MSCDVNFEFFIYVEFYCHEKNNLIRKRQFLQVGVIGNLVHSSPSIKKEVLAAGALQPVIGLLRFVKSCFFFFGTLKCLSICF